MAALKDGNMQLVGVEKGNIEHQQREMRKRERAEGTVWQSRYFERVERDAVIEEMGYQCEGEKTGGLWRLNEIGEKVLS